LLQQILVRHKKEDVLKEVEIPGCQVKTVNLEMSPQERTKYNARIASIKVLLFVLCKEEGSRKKTGNPMKTKQNQPGQLVTL